MVKSGTSRSRRRVISQCDPESESPVRLVESRKIPHTVSFGLIAATAGRCEFLGCNKQLYVHPVTNEPGVFAERAHIVAFRERGPRGDDGPRPEDINSFENLMLLCQPCHKLVDDNPRRYLRADLELFKAEHEDRIRWITGLGPEMQASVLLLKAKIGAHVVSISQAEIFDALRPRYPAGHSTIIDLTGLGDERTGAFYAAAAETIRSEVRRFYAAGSEIERSKQLAVLGLAPIPLLMVLGASLSNKVSTDFFQCHRDKTNRWTWATGLAPVAYTVTHARKGTAPDKVALVLSLSGAISLTSLPAHVDESFSVYVLTLQDVTPNPGFLRQREDLDAFRATYRSLLAELRKQHPSARQLHVFPAVPAPVAIACGFDLLPKVDPVLCVYDNVQAEGGFVQRLNVESHEW